MAWPCKHIPAFGAGSGFPCEVSYPVHSAGIQRPQLGGHTKSGQPSNIIHSMLLLYTFSLVLILFYVFWGIKYMADLGNDGLN